MRATHFATKFAGLGLSAGVLACAAPPQPPPAAPPSAPGSAAQPSVLEVLTRPIPVSLPNAEQVRRGQYLARAGDCGACHTRPGGPAFAGSNGLRTPFGVIYSTNLTSDAETGVGRISPETFYTALHEGVGPKGGQIYPAMPYAYYTRITRADSDALLAFFKTVPAVSARRPANALPFPLDHRAMVRGWKLLFFRPGEFRPDPGHSAAWNRGAYLVNGPGHCGSCHTPVNRLGAERSDQGFRGGNLENWVAPDLTGRARTGLGRWSRDDIVEYLKTGRNQYANAGGLMGEVVGMSTSLMTDADLQAMAVYLKDLPASPPDAARAPPADSLQRGGAIFSDACASCHLSDGGGQARLFPPLAGNAVAQQRDPAGVMHLILAGARTAPTALRPTPAAMPSFAWKLTDQEVADVATYVRNSWGNHASAVSARDVAGVRKRLRLESQRPTDNSGDREPPSASGQTRDPR